MYKGAKVMKKLLMVLCLFMYACDLPTSPTEIQSKKKFSMNTAGLSTTKLNDSTYYFYIDTLQWQTFERLTANTDENIPIKIYWDAYSTKKAYYYHAGIFFNAPLTNAISYTNKDGVASNMLSVYKEMISDTVLAISGYNDGINKYYDYKYFIILMKN